MTAGTYELRFFTSMCSDAEVAYGCIGGLAELGRATIVAS